MRGGPKRAGRYHRRAMRVRPSLAVLAAAALALAGCGPAGTWVDDAGNWRRAFASDRPGDVEVVHSKYWRSPHFTREFQYFFHLRRNDAFRRRLFAENRLVRREGEAASKAASDFFGEKPGWFLPGEGREYEVWVLEGEPDRHFRLFIDGATGDLFLTDWCA